MINYRKSLYTVIIHKIKCQSIKIKYKSYNYSQVKVQMTGAGDSDYQAKIAATPKYGLKVKLNHEYPEKRTPNFIPPLQVIIYLLPLTLRYIWYYIKTKWAGGRVVMDFLGPRDSKQMYGVPIGGIGSGSIGRGFKGEFCRFQMRPGLYEWNTVDANQFIVTIKDEKETTIFQSLLSTFSKSSLSSWKSGIDANKCTYTGLYPRAWTEYDLSEYGIKLTCRQISPVIPHDYENSCLPCAVFVWDIENVSKEQRTVTVAFTFKNGTGNSKEDGNSTCSSKSFSYENTEGVILYHTIDKMQCSYALSAKLSDNVSISKCLYFDPKSDGSKPWTQLREDGEFEKLRKSIHKQVFGEMACGIATKATVSPTESKQMEMSLAWDMPTINFPKKLKTYRRFYTKQFGTENAILKIVSHAFENYTGWERSIYDWQKVVLDDSKLPDWYKGALFNETYYVSDGGTLWFALDDEEMKNLSENDPRRTYGRFAYLEGQEYIMYNSYDVHFYASHALHKNWPYLQKCLNYDLRDFVSVEIADKVKMLYDGQVVERKVPNSIPHDAGTAGEEPLTLINSYNIHDVSLWRDLNPKFVLQSYRDAFSTKSGNIDKEYIKDMYETCFNIMQKAIKNDVDKDGLIENSGSPDQTYDSWVMSGVSAYCGGLWLGALYAMISMADQLGILEDKKLFEDLFAKAKPAFEKKLWNGEYYDFDQSKDSAKSIMADQLCGHWYLRCCGVEDYDVFPKDHVKTVLNTIYKNNVQSFCDGNMGAVNGFLNGKADEGTVQSVEVWTGITYALAATMIQEGMTEEGFNTARGMYLSMVEKFGMAFDTPEALYGKGYYRSLAYMRPLSIWSMQIALEAEKKYLRC